MPEEREKIFEPFYRGHGDAERSSDGAGLGLAIVRQIARAHGADVALVPTANGKGARFEVSLRRGTDAVLGREGTSENEATEDFEVRRGQGAHPD